MVTLIYQAHPSCNLHNLVGNSSPPGVIRAATQYNTACRIVDLCTFDVTRHPWRCGGLFDAIVTDPPCKKPLFSSFLHTYFLSDGVRAGAKRIGRKKDFSPSRLAEFVEHRKLPQYVALFRVIFLLRIAFVVMTNLTFLQQNLMNFHNLPMTS